MPFRVKLYTILDIHLQPSELQQYSEDHSKRKEVQKKESGQRDRLEAVSNRVGGSRIEAHYLLRGFSFNLQKGAGSKDPCFVPLFL